ncbi:MAG: Phosphoesterase, partial [uncultured Nocardioides sp.]
WQRSSCWWRTRTYPDAPETFLCSSGRRSRTPTSSSTPGTGSTSASWMRWRSAHAAWSPSSATTTTARSASACRRWRGSRSTASDSGWSTRPERRRAVRSAAAPSTRTSTCWSSGTATSRGTRPARPACDCSTPARRPIDADSRSAPTPRPPRTRAGSPRSPSTDFPHERLRGRRLRGRLP